VDAGRHTPAIETGEGTHRLGAASGIPWLGTAKSALLSDMELINVVVARSVWLFRLEELNSPGVRFDPTVARALETRYDFQPHKQGELQFAKGRFTVNGVDLDVKLQIYDDGMVAETYASTAQSDAFLHDMLTWAADQFKLNYHPGLVKNRIYYSEVVVHAEVALNEHCEKLARFARRLSAASVFGKPQIVTGVIFNSEERILPSFSLERRENVPFAENRYYSRAALQTEPHLDLLGEFEALFTSRNMNRIPATPDPVS
jgi:hypothetical protein